MYRLATKGTAKRVEENVIVSFFQTKMTSCVLAYSALLTEKGSELELINNMDFGHHA